APRCRRARSGRRGRGSRARAPSGGAAASRRRRRAPSRPPRSRADHIPPARLTGGEEKANIGPMPPPPPRALRTPAALATDYAELRCHSAFSFLEGASNPEDLAQRAAELEHPTLALADRGGLYGAPRFHQAAQAEGVRAIVGAELDLAAGPPGARVLLLVESREGYRHLARLISRGHGAGASARRAAAPRAASARGRKAGCRASWDDV